MTRSAHGFYLLRRTQKEGELVITKLNPDLEFENAYNLTKLKCTCPAFTKHPDQLCKHIKLIGLFERTGNIDSGRMWNSANGMWRDPILEKDILDDLLLGDLPKDTEEALVQVIAPALESETTIRAVAQPSKEFNQPALKPIRRR